MIKRLLVRCTHCGHTWFVARPTKNHKCPMCGKTGIKPMVP